MPKVPERQLSPGEISAKLKPVRTYQPGTKNFATFDFVEPRKGSKNGAVKITRPPKVT